MDLIHIGASLAFAVLHLLLYAFLRREQGNLYFALFALGYAGMAWGTYQLEQGDDAFRTTLRVTFTGSSRPSPWSVSPIWTSSTAARASSSRFSPGVRESSPGSGSSPRRRCASNR